MSFLHPGYFLALLGLLPLLAVYFLKIRPTQKIVTAYFLWEAVFEKKKNTALFNRLRDLLSLLLMILALLMVVLAMTEPEMAAGQRQDLLLIIDNSASMNALDHGKVTRLDTAKQKARDIVKSLNGNQQAAMATVSMDIQFNSHLTASPKSLMDAIESIEPSDCPLNAKALGTLTSAVTAMNAYRLILLSDGCGLSNDVGRPTELIKIGAAPQDNIGFVACDMRMLHTQPPHFGLYYRLASSLEHTIETEILLTYGPDNALIKVIPVTVTPGLNAPEVHTIEAGGPGPWKVLLDREDGLPNDNTAFLVLQPKRPVTMGVDSEYPFFLVNSVLAFSKTSGELQYVQDKPEVVLSSGTASQAACSVMFNVPPGDNWCGKVGEEIDHVMAEIRIEDHSILRQCDIDTMPFVGARHIDLPPNSLVIVETADQVPLIYRVRDKKRSAIVINMDMVQSEFYYSAWFPVLVYNSARYLMGQQDTRISACRVGETVTIPTAAFAQETTRITLNNEPDGFDIVGSSYGPIQKTGFHHLNNSTGQWSFGANLFDLKETLLDNEHVDDTRQAINRGWPLSILMGSLAIALLLTEAILYHLRKVG